MIEIKMVENDLADMVSLRNDLRVMLFTLSGWTTSFVKSSHKCFIGKALYQIALCIETLENRIKQLVINDFYSSINISINEIYPEVFTTALKRKEAIEDNVNLILMKIEQYILKSEGLRDEPSIIAVNEVKNRLVLLLELLLDYDRQDSFNKTEELQLNPITPSREPIYEIKSYGDKLQVSKKEYLLYTMHEIALCIELVAIEICSTMMFENRHMPWQFFLDLSRQCYDEARHYEMLIKRVREMGGTPGMYPIDFFVWEMARSGRTLGEQLAIQQVVQEGHGLDANVVNVNLFKKFNAMENASIFNYINVDESDHVRIGCKWMLYECNGNIEKANSLVDNIYNNLLSVGFSPKYEVQEEERRWSGMSIEQIEKAKEVVKVTLEEVMSKK